jgi:hypothetical protein
VRILEEELHAQDGVITIPPASDHDVGLPPLDCRQEVMSIARVHQFHVGLEPHGIFHDLPQYLRHLTNKDSDSLQCALSPEASE